MGKDEERSRPADFGPDDRRYILDTPFSTAHAGKYFSDMGLLLTLLPPPPGKLLDLGVAGGWTSVTFAQRGYDVTGQDIAEGVLDIAKANKARAGLDNLEFIACDFEKLAFQNAFDCAVFYNSLHHALDEEKALSAVYRALKPGGMCLTVEPGVGHARSQESIRARDEWGFTERDMPPAVIIRAGKKVGFRQCEIYFRQWRTFGVGRSFTIRSVFELFRLVAKSLPGLAGRQPNLVRLVK